MKRLLQFSSVVACALLVSTPAPSLASLKRIIEMYDEILPLATLSDNGRQLTIPINGNVGETVPGLRTELIVLVYQESTGASAVGNHRSPFNIDAEVVPERFTVDVRANAIGGTEFEEGWAEVTYLADEIQNGKVIRRWSRTENVFLNQLPSQGPVLKGDLAGELSFDDSGFAAFTGSGRLTLMGKVDVYGEFQFIPEPISGGAIGIGVMSIQASNGDVLVSNVSWQTDAEGNGDLEFRWPDEITFVDGMIVESTGRFIELPFAGLKGTAELSRNVDWGDGLTSGTVSTVIKMTGEIVDPDPIDI